MIQCKYKYIKTVGQFKYKLKSHIHVCDYINSNYLVLIHVTLRGRAKAEAVSKTGQFK